jgi:hypothetical protein
MTYSFLTIPREHDVRHVVQPPRSTDIVGRLLRGAFKAPVGIPHDMARMLQQLGSI